MTLGEMTDADKVMNPQHTGNDPADIRIQIRINMEIWIRILDHFWLRLDALAEVCALWAQSIIQFYRNGSAALYYSLKISRRNPCSPFFSVSYSINCHKIL